MLLQASGQSVLQSLGLLDAIIARAERIEQLIAYTHRGKLLSHLRFADGPGGHVAFGLHRGDLFAVLHAVVTDAGVSIRLNRTIGRVDLDGCALIDTDNRSVGRFDLIVAADGSRSRLRRASGLRAIVAPYQPAALWAVVHDSFVHGQLLQHARHTRELCGLLPMGAGRASLFWGIDSVEWPKLKRRSFSSWQRQVIELMPGARSAA